MNIDKLKRIIAVLKEENLDEIEVKGLFSSIRVARRKASVLPDSAGLSVNAVPADRAGDARENDAKGGGNQIEGGEADLSPEGGDSEYEGLEKLLSPMVGTFYRASDPEDEPYVSPGKRVKKGETVCIIEAMKLMNEIEAEFGGVIEKVMVENSQPVEYGQPLFLIKPD